MAVGGVKEEHSEYYKLLRNIFIISFIQRIKESYGIIFFSFLYFYHYYAYYFRSYYAKNENSFAVKIFKFLLKTGLFFFFLLLLFPSGRETLKKILRCRCFASLIFLSPLRVFFPRQLFPKLFLLLNGYTKILYLRLN